MNGGVIAEEDADDDDGGGLPEDGEKDEEERVLWEGFLWDLGWGWLDVGLRLHCFSEECVVWFEILS